MSTIPAVDLSRLPAPAIVEEINYETILEDMLTDLRSRDTQFNTLSQADPAYKILQVCAYREMILRQRVNDSARAVMLAKAAGSDLDQIVAREPYNIARLLVDAGNAEADPPLPAVWESDDELRRRAQLAPARYSTAGPEDAYIFFTLSADARVLDASARSEEEGHVIVTVLSRVGDGTAAPDLLDAVTAALNPRFVRPLTDFVEVQSAVIVDYTIEVELTLYSGPDESVVIAASEARVADYKERSRLLGREISISSIIAAAHVEGVHKASVISPAADVSIALDEIANCTGISITVVGRYE